MMDNTFIIVIITFIKLRINVLGIWEVGWVGVVNMMEVLVTLYCL